MVGEDVVDLESDRPGEQDQEAEIDHRVHQPGLTIPHQRFHPKAPAELGDPLPPEAGAILGSTDHPDLGSLGEEDGGQGDESSRREIEDDLEPAGHVAENQPADLGFLMLGQGAEEPEEKGGEGGESPENDQQRPTPRGGVGGFRLYVSVVGSDGHGSLHHPPLPGR